MTTKNGLPCNESITFIQDKEKRWWLYTRVAWSSSRIPSSSDGGPTRRRYFKPRVYDQLDGAQPNHMVRSILAAMSPDGRVWFANGLVVQVVDPSRLLRKALPAETYIESVIVDRKEFPANRKPQGPAAPSRLAD